MGICSDWVSANLAEQAYCNDVSKSRYVALFRRKRFVKPRLATIGRVAVNDSAFGRFVDSRNRRANLIGTAL
jgi:hypothetical protein